MKKKSIRPKKIQKSIRLSSTGIERLSILVENTGRSESSVIEDALDEYYNHHIEWHNKNKNEENNKND